MSAKRMFYVMLGVSLLLFIAIFGVVVIGDKTLKAQSDKLVVLKVDDQVVEGQQAALSQALKDIENYNELNDIARQIVPQDKDQARATREIIRIAADAGVSIGSVSFPDSTLGQAPVKTTKPSTDDKAAAEPVAPVKPTPTVTQVEAVPGIEGVYELKITVVSDTASPATYNQLLNFLKGLEHNRRTAGVSDISIQPDAENRSLLNFTLSVTEYIKP